MGGIAKSDLPRELRSFYDWAGTYYRLRPEAVEAFWNHYGYWAQTSAGRAWLERARLAHAATALVSRWRLGRALPKRVFFVHVCSVFGWSVADFFPALAQLQESKILAEVFPRNGRNNSIIGVEHRQQFRESLERLWSSRPSLARRQAAKMRAWYNWLQKVRSGLIGNVSPDMLQQFAEAIGRSAAGLVRPSVSSHLRPPVERRAPRQRSPAARRDEVLLTPARTAEPKPWSFFGDVER